MLRIMIMMIVALNLILTTASLAQAPATNPSAPTTRISADQNTPQGAYILLMRATQSGDAATVKRVLHSTNAQESALADLLSQSVDQNQKFRKAVAKSFSDQVADQFAGGPGEAEQAEAEISKAKVTIDKTSATVQLDELSDPVKLTQIDGQWKVAVAGLSAGPGEQVRIKLLLTVLSEVTDELGQGKYKTEDELRDALQSKGTAAMFAAAREAAAQPATAPAVP